MPQGAPYVPRAMGSSDGLNAVLVTGGGRGIGRAVSLAAAKQGWAVGLTYRADREAAENTVRHIESIGGRGVAIRADVRDANAVERAFTDTERKLRRIEAVVNNAGIVAPLRPLAEMTPDRLQRVIDVNVVGALLVAREAARRLSTERGGGGGVLVNVSSAASRLGSPGEYVDYAASKGAIDTLTLGLAKELGPQGVRVNAVRPGLIATDLHASSEAPDRAERLGANTPLGRPGEAAEVASAVVWLLGKEASYVTGALLDIAGGR